jgi:hypothetical protein
LHRFWEEKRAILAPHRKLVRRYEAALEAGAVGGMTTGLSGDAFLVLLCPVEWQARVTEALSALGCSRWPLTLDDGGVYAMEGIPWSRAGKRQGVAWEASDSPQRAHTEPTDGLAQGVHVQGGQRETREMG